MNTKRVKTFAIIAFAAVAAAFYGFRTTPAAAVTPAPPDDVAAVYKAKCLLCHGPKAAKGYKADMPKEEKIQIILKGKKTEKPPAMPGFESKGINAEQAAALVDYMDGLKAKADE